MGYRSQTYEDFGAGLNLSVKADAVGPAEAIDALNVTYNDRGAVEQRWGYAQLTASELTNRAETLAPYYTTGGTKHLLCGCGTRLEAINTSGAVVASQTGLTTGTWQFARFGTPNSEVAYAGNGANLLYKWNGSAWASVSSTPKAGALAVAAVSNRLVATRFTTTTGGPDGSGSSSSPSHVYFSSQGLPETWPVDNYLELTPGDGEAIQAAIAWREFIFVFKESKFFVFSGESQDADGTAVFDYRMVDTGVGAVGPKAVCANESGVYFIDRRGVYVSTGGEPTLVSEAIDPIFLGGAESYFTGGVQDHTLVASAALSSHQERLYLAYSSNGTTLNRTLVFDYINGWWTLFDFPANDFASFRISTKEELVFAYSAGTKDVARYNSTLTNDDSVAITSRWRSGFSNLEVSEQKRVREQKVWGSGKVFCGVTVDYKQYPGDLTLLDMTDPSVTYWNSGLWNVGTWASPNVLVPKLRRVAVRGTLVSVYLSNSMLNQSWSVHRIGHNLAAVRQPSIKKAAS